MDDLKEILYDKLDLIQSLEIRAFVKVALDNAPKYFWTLKASTSGKYHHGETLLQHVLYALTYAQSHIRMLQWYWDQETKDVFYAAIFLHDLYRCGMEGRELTDEDGQLRTDRLHPIYPASELARLEIPVEELPYKKWEEPFPCFKFSWFKKFQKAVLSHMGPWSPISDLNPMNDNALSLRFHVFLVDYVASRECQRTIVPELQEETHA